MKNIFLGAAFLLSAAFSFGQNCTPEVITNGEMMSPSVEDNIATADSLGDYEQIVTFIVPKDTNHLGQDTTIERFTVTSIDGLPSGFDFDCNPGDCVFPSLESSCLRLYGEVTESMQGDTYPLTVNYIADGQLHVGSLGWTNVSLELTITGFELHVAGILSSNKVNMEQQLKFEDGLIQVSSQYNSILNVYGVTGKLVKSVNLSKGGTQMINLLELQKGIYVLDLINENGRISKKIAI